MKACAEKHVLDALDVHQRSLAPLNDVVSSALVTLQATEQCPGPNCGIPVEHAGDQRCCGKCTPCHALQVAVRLCTA